MANTISRVGNLYSKAIGANVTTLSVTPAGVGNTMVLCTNIFSSSITVASVSGGGCTNWRKVAGPFSFTSPGTMRHEWWLGDVQTTGSATITITGSASLSSTQVGLQAQELGSGGGSGTTWTADGSGNSITNTSSTTVTFPTLTPAGTLRAYIGYGYVLQTGSASTPTSGYTAQITVTNSNIVILGPNVAQSAQSPTGSQSPAATSNASSILLTATNPAAGGGAWFMACQHHHEPHDDLAARRNRSGLWLPRRRDLTVARAA